MRERRAHDRQGFTLVEMLAVVLLIGLTFAIALPNLGASRARRLEGRAMEVAGRVEAARERAIVTGAAHRLWLHLEDGAMRIDWYVDEERASKAQGLDEEYESDPVVPAAANQPVSLLPPQAAERDYYPVPNALGREKYLNEAFFEGVETPEGYIEDGEVQLVFGRDGTTDYAEIFMADEWDNRIVLEIQPLLDVVRIHWEEDS